MRAMGFEMFDLRAMSSTDVLFAATRGHIRPRSGRPSPLNFPMQGLKANAAFSSLYALLHLRCQHTFHSQHIMSYEQCFSYASEAMGEERCYEAEYGRSVIERVFDEQ